LGKKSKEAERYARKEKALDLRRTGAGSFESGKLIAGKRGKGTIEGIRVQEEALSIRRIEEIAGDEEGKR